MQNSIKAGSKIQEISHIQVKKFTDYIIDIDLKPTPLPQEFFYASLPLCVIDAVFSIGVTYTSTRNTVARFCELQAWTMTDESHGDRTKGEHTIEEFLNLFVGLTPERMANDLFGNHQRTSSRSGILKAEAVHQFALALRNSEINDFADLTEHRLKETEKLILGIPGQGSGISFDYFRMLAGDNNLVKPDRMVQRFIAKSLGIEPKQVSPDVARELMKGAVEQLIKRGCIWSPRELDYVIWQRESSGE